MSPMNVMICSDCRLLDFSAPNKRRSMIAARSFDPATEGETLLVPASVRESVR
jgi:hypothetical protein